MLVISARSRTREHDREAKLHIAGVGAAVGADRRSHLLDEPPFPGDQSDDHHGIGRFDTAGLHSAGVRLHERELAALQQRQNDRQQENG